MAAKGTEAGCLTKVIVGLFTTVVAPVLVNILVQGITPVTASALLADKVQTTSVAENDGPHDVVVSEGRGRSPLEANQQAVRAAVLRVVGPLVEPGTPPELQRAICEEVIMQPGVILNCRDAGCSRERGDAGEAFCDHVTVEVLQKPVTDRLRAVGCLKKVIQ